MHIVAQLRACMHYAVPRNPPTGGCSNGSERQSFVSDIASQLSIFREFRLSNAWRTTINQSRNDRDRPFGHIGNLGCATFLCAMEFLVDEIRKANPTVRFVFITPPFRYTHDGTQIEEMNRFS
jgi:hypothetical protein